jgi:ribosomal protein S25
MAKKKVNEEKEEEDESEDLVMDDDKVNKVQAENHVRKMNRKYGKVATLETIQRDPYLPMALETKLRKELMKMKAITANELASKYDVRVSTMKKFLLTLESEGKLTRSASSSRLKVFNPVQ